MSTQKSIPLQTQLVNTGSDKKDFKKAKPIKKKGPRRVCKGKHCRTIIYGRNFCSKCRHRKLKMEDPMEYAYRMQKSNARKRKPKHFPNGIPFTVSREAYRALWEQHPEKWAEKVKSLQSKNKGRTCRWEVDRKDPFKGYEEGNLRIVSKIMNILYWYNNRSGQMELDLTVWVDDDIEEKWKDEVPF